jgi:hypothetical protein
MRNSKKAVMLHAMGNSYFIVFNTLCYLNLWPSACSIVPQLTMLPHTLCALQCVF